MSNEDDTRAGGVEQRSTPMPAGRLAAELSKSADVRRAEVQFPYRLKVTITNSGLGRTDLKTIREYGWRISGFTPRFNSVSVVSEDRFSVRGGDRHV